ncbi:uncharacterized protein LOC125773317 isoform X1 [Anopheles funestus]|uniref:uncharacterized protein LOC125773317 isoform X1 n=1 Tax=Anopheles funestus TaxID=62324 RepID=UPI0020C6D617|nr:uncharacterized protein LOC125773317 isoform X1 [Anopheles funestus]XP_049300304.1 uncharacterized protein LOC125773317 isoform X1 [Anopheles funestus]
MHTFTVFGNTMCLNGRLIAAVLLMQALTLARCLQLTDITVPEVVDVRETVTLSCSYDMGMHKLNSVKWYKDEREFFRYSPMMPKSLMFFDVDGVTLLENSTVQICNQFMCSIQLYKLTIRSSGSYRCEISGDAPEFKLAHGVGNMTVAVYPQFEPIINGLQHNGGQHNYALGDFVVANCSSDMSSPPARLYWYINDRNVPSEYLQPQHETTVENDGFLLRSRTLEIRFYIDEKRLGKLKDKLVLKCLARIDSIPQATRESSQIIHIPTADALRNQKLINWRGSDASPLHHTDMHRMFVVLCIALGFFTWLV